MPISSEGHPAAQVRPIPIIPIYLFSLLSALAVCLGMRFGQSARTALICAGFLSAAVAVACFARFLVAADESLQTINYRALVFAFVSSLAFTLILDFLRSLGLRIPVVPTFGFPISMIILWTLGLVLAAAWQRANEEPEE